MDPLNLSTSGGGPVGLRTSIPGSEPLPGIGPSGANVPIYGGFLSYLMGQQQKSRDMELKARQYSLDRQREMDARADADRIMARGPQMGVAPKNDLLTRQVIDPYDNPYDGLTFAVGSLAGTHTPKYVTERFIGGKWEFDNLDPRRQGSGGRGSIEMPSIVQRAPAQTIQQDIDNMMGGKRELSKPTQGQSKTSGGLL